MAIDAVFVSRTTISGSSGTSTGATTTASGSTFVVLMSYDATTTASTPTDNKGNTYTQAGTTLTDGTGAKVGIYYSANATGGPGHTVTASFSGSSFAVIHFIEVTGAASASFDQAVSAADFISPYTVTSGTLAQAAEVVLTIACLNGSTSGTANTYSSSNTTILSQEIDAANWWTSAVSKLVTSATTAVTPSFTVALGQGGGLFLASFKEATAGAVTGTISKTNANDTSAISGNVTTPDNPLYTSLINIPYPWYTNPGWNSLYNPGLFGIAVANRVNLTTVTGTITTTLINDIPSIVGNTTVIGTISKTTVNDTSAITGQLTVVGTITKTTPNDLSSISGTVGSAVVGAINYIAKPDTTVFTGNVTVTGSLTSTSSNDTSNISGTILLSGALSYTNKSDIAAAFGTVGATGGTNTTRLTLTNAGAS